MSVQVKLNSAGVRELLQSTEVLAHLLDRADKIAERANSEASKRPEPAFEVDGGVGRTRARASVRSVTIYGRILEAKRKTLTRAIDAGRG